jgi:diguanylate cyclase (GGDEF)-like protein
VSSRPERPPSAGRLVDRAACRFVAGLAGWFVGVPIVLVGMLAPLGTARAQDLSPPAIAARIDALRAKPDAADALREFERIEAQLDALAAAERSHPAWHAQRVALATALCERRIAADAAGPAYEGARQRLELLRNDAPQRPPAELLPLRLCANYARAESGGDKALAAVLAEYGAIVELAGDAPRWAVERESARVYRGELLVAQGAVAEGLADLTQALRMLEALADVAATRPVRRYALTAIANAYSDAALNQHDKAIEYYRLLLADAERAAQPREQATALFNIGASQQALGQHAAAIDSLQRAMLLARQVADADTEAEALRLIGKAEAARGRLADGLTALERAVELHARHGHDERVAATQLTRGIVLLGASRAREALADLQRARREFASKDNARYLARIERELAHAHAALGQWREAFDALQQHLRWQNQLQERGQLLAAQRFRVQFDVERTEQSNRLLKLENAARAEQLRAERQISRLRNLALGLGGALLLALALATWRARRHAAQMQRIATTDELTGLPNRRALFAAAAQARDGAAGADIGVLLLDIDHFKRVNDSLGHDAGDRVLQRVAAAAATSLRRGVDTLARSGGEEFTAILPRCDAATLAALAEGLRAAVAALDVRDLGLERISVSVGATLWHGAQADRHGEGADEPIDAAIKRADEALYRSKAQGRDRVTLA